MKRIILPLSSLVLIVCLSGCTGSVPKCGDEDTIALVKNIVTQQMGEDSEATAAEMKAQLVVEYPRASGFKESIKKYECEARLVGGGTYQLPITYESQIDDGGQHVVAVGGIGRGDLAQLEFAIVVQIKQAREIAARAHVVSAPVAAPQPPPTPTPRAPNDAAAQAVVAPTSAPASNAPVAQAIVPSPLVSREEERRDEPSQTKPADVENVPSEPAEPASTKVEVAKPSFDCGRATTLVENTICGDGELASLDDLLAKSYARMMSSDIGDGARVALKADQRAWLGRRNQCSSKPCLVDIYQSRIDEVCDTPVISGVHPDCGR